MAYGTYTCDPQRPQHVFEAVRDLYGPYALVYRVEALGLTGGDQQSLLVKAQTVLARYQAGDKKTAANMANALANQAADEGYTVLAEQARLIAGDLRQ